MTPVFSEARHDPEAGFYGDCYSACLASILDLPLSRVPHFFNDDREPSAIQFARLDDWLREQSLTRFSFLWRGEDTNLRSVLDTLETLNRDRYMILGGRVGASGDHAVVICGGEIAHNPSRGGATIDSPSSDGFYHVHIFAPISMVQEQRHA